MSRSTSPAGKQGYELYNRSSASSLGFADVRFLPSPLVSFTGDETMDSVAGRAAADDQPVQRPYALPLRKPGHDAEAAGMRSLPLLPSRKGAFSVPRPLGRRKQSVSTDPVTEPHIGPMISSDATLWNTASMAAERTFSQRVNFSGWVSEPLQNELHALEDHTLENPDGRLARAVVGTTPQVRLLSLKASIEESLRNNEFDPLFSPDDGVPADSPGARPLQSLHTLEQDVAEAGAVGGADGPPVPADESAADEGVLGAHTVSDGAPASPESPTKPLCGQLADEVANAMAADRISPEEFVDTVAHPSYISLARLAADSSASPRASPGRAPAGTDRSLELGLTAATAVSEMELFTLALNNGVDYLGSIARMSGALVDAYRGVLSHRGQTDNAPAEGRLTPLDAALLSLVKNSNFAHLLTQFQGISPALKMITRVRDYYIARFLRRDTGAAAAQEAARQMDAQISMLKADLAQEQASTATQATVLARLTASSAAQEKLIAQLQTQNFRSSRQLANVQNAFASYQQEFHAMAGENRDLKAEKGEAFQRAKRLAAAAGRLRVIADSAISRAQDAEKRVAAETRGRQDLEKLRTQLQDEVGFLTKQARKMEKAHATEVRELEAELSRLSARLAEVSADPGAPTYDPDKTLKELLASTDVPGVIRGAAVFLVEMSTIDAHNALSNLGVDVGGLSCLKYILRAIENTDTAQAFMAAVKLEVSAQLRQNVKAVAVQTVVSLGRDGTIGTAHRDSAGSETDNIDTKRVQELNSELSRHRVELLARTREVERLTAKLRRESRNVEQRRGSSIDGSSHRPSEAAGKAAGGPAGGAPSSLDTSMELTADPADGHAVKIVDPDSRGSKRRLSQRGNGADWEQRQADKAVRNAKQPVSQRPLLSGDPNILRRKGKKGAPQHITQGGATKAGAAVSIEPAASEDLPRLSASTSLVNMTQSEVSSVNMAEEVPHALLDSAQSNTELDSASAQNPVREIPPESAVAIPHSRSESREGNAVSSRSLSPEQSPSPNRHDEQGSDNGDRADGGATANVARPAELVSGVAVPTPGESEHDEVAFFPTSSRTQEMPLTGRSIGAATPEIPSAESLASLMAGSAVSEDTDDGSERPKSRHVRSTRVARAMTPLTQRLTLPPREQNSLPKETDDTRASLAHDAPSSAHSPQTSARSARQADTNESIAICLTLIQDSNARKEIQESMDTLLGDAQTSADFKAALTQYAEENHAKLTKTSTPSDAQSSLLTFIDRFAQQKNISRAALTLQQEQPAESPEAPSPGTAPEAPQLSEVSAGAQPSGEADSSQQDGLQGGSPRDEVPGTVHTPSAPPLPSKLGPQPAQAAPRTGSVGYWESVRRDIDTVYREEIAFRGIDTDTQTAALGADHGIQHNAPEVRNAFLEQNPDLCDSAFVAYYLNATLDEADPLRTADVRSFRGVERLLAGFSANMQTDALSSDAFERAPPQPAPRVSVATREDSVQTELGVFATPYRKRTSSAGRPAIVQYGKTERAMYSPELVQKGKMQTALYSIYAYDTDRQDELNRGAILVKQEGRGAERPHTGDRVLDHASMRGPMRGSMRSAHAPSRAELPQGSRVQLKTIPELLRERASDPGIKPEVAQSLNDLSAYLALLESWVGADRSGAAADAQDPLQRTPLFGDGADVMGSAAREGRIKSSVLSVGDLGITGNDLDPARIDQYLQYAKRNALNTIDPKSIEALKRMADKISTDESFAVMAYLMSGDGTAEGKTETTADGRIRVQPRSREYYDQYTKDVSAKSALDARMLVASVLSAARRGPSSPVRGTKGGAAGAPGAPGAPGVPGVPGDLAGTNSSMVVSYAAGSPVRTDATHLSQVQLSTRRYDRVYEVPNRVQALLAAGGGTVETDPRAAVQRTLTPLERAMDMVGVPSARAPSPETAVSIAKPDLMRRKYSGNPAEIGQRPAYSFKDFVNVVQLARTSAPRGSTAPALPDPVSQLLPSTIQRHPRYGQVPWTEPDPTRCPGLSHFLVQTPFDKLYLKYLPTPARREAAEGALGATAQLSASALSEPATATASATSSGAVLYMPCIVARRANFLADMSTPACQMQQRTAQAFTAEMNRFTRVSAQVSELHGTVPNLRRALLPEVSEAVAFIRVSSVTKAQPQAQAQAQAQVPEADSATPMPVVFALLEGLTRAQVQTVLAPGTGVAYVRVPTTGCALKSLAWTLRFIRLVVSARLGMSESVICLSRANQHSEACDAILMTELAQVQDSAALDAARAAAPERPYEFSVVPGKLSRLEAESLPHFILYWCKSRYGIRTLISNLLWCLITALAYYQYESDEVYLFARMFFGDLDSDFFTTYLELRRMLMMDGGAYALAASAGSAARAEPTRAQDVLRPETVRLDLLPNIVHSVFTTWEDKRKYALTETLYSLAYSKIDLSAHARASARAGAHAGARPQGPAPPTEMPFVSLVQIILFAYASFRRTVYQAAQIIWLFYCKEHKTYTYMGEAAFREFCERVVPFWGFESVTEMFYAFSTSPRRDDPYTQSLSERRLEVEGLVAMFLSCNLTRFATVTSEALDKSVSTGVKRHVFLASEVYRRLRQVSDGVLRHFIFYDINSGDDKNLILCRRIRNAINVIECDLASYDYVRALSQMRDTLNMILDGLITTSAEAATIALGGTIGALSGYLETLEPAAAGAAETEDQGEGATAGEGAAAADTYLVRVQD